MARAVRIWCACRDSIIEPRIRRATMASCGSMRVSTGPTLLTKAPSPQPPTGNQWSVSAKKSWNSGAMTKVGMVLPAVAMRHHRIVRQLVLAQGCPNAKGAADEKRKDQGHGAELEGDRQARLEQFGDGEIRQIVTWAEITAQQVLQIVEVLTPQRLIEMENPFKIGLDDGIEPLLLVERAARAPHASGKTLSSQSRRELGWQSEIAGRRSAA